MKFPHKLSVTWQPVKEQVENILQRMS